MVSRKKVVSARLYEFDNYLLPNFSFAAFERDFSLEWYAETFEMSRGVGVLRYRNVGLNDTRCFFPPVIGIRFGKPDGNVTTVVGTSSPRRIDPRQPDHCSSRRSSPATPARAHLTHSVYAHVQRAQPAPGAVPYSGRHLLHPSLGVHAHQRARALLVVVRMPFHGLAVVRLVVVRRTLHRPEIQSVGTRLRTARETQKR